MCQIYVVHALFMLYFLYFTLFASIPIFCFLCHLATVMWMVNTIEPGDGPEGATSNTKTNDSEYFFEN